MTPEGAAALIGNAEAESDGFYFDRVEYLLMKRFRDRGISYTDKSYTAAIDSGKISAEEFLHPIAGNQYGYGIVQWTSPGRKSGLWNLAKRKGVSIADEDMQIEYLLWELENSYPSVLKVLKTTHSIREASDIVLKKFEQPSDTGETVCKGRAARGQKFYDDNVKSTKKEDTKVGVRVSNCGHDENNRYSGGAAGDQTGTEWYLRGWYAYPWNYVLRWKDQTLADLFADLAVEAAENSLIGYDQNQRNTFWSHLKASNYRPAQITIACEADCSSGTIALIRAVGFLKGIKELQNCNATYTGDMMPWFRSVAGQKYFEILTGKHLTDSSVARRGDINLNTAHHVNITVDNGANAGSGSSGAGNSASGSSNEYIGRGDTGSAVKKMQEMLIACGYSCGPCGADGDFGAGTEQAVKNFQKKKGLDVDGLYGQKTKKKLEAAYKKKTAVKKKTITEIAEEVIAGKWGNGEDRIKKLKDVGYDYTAVQNEVNRLLK